MPSAAAVVVREVDHRMGLAHPVAVEGALEPVGVVAGRRGSLSPLDLKWLTTTRNPSESKAPLRLNSWASGSRALAKASPGSDRSPGTRDGPTSETVSGS